MTAQPTPTQIVQHYFDKHYRVVLWPDKGELKGPIEKGWPSNVYKFEDYAKDKRVGLITGQEVSPGKFLHDVDIDWADGYNIALQFLPSTEFVYGRQSKHVSHCFYTLPEPCCIPPFRDPVDKTTLLEIRGTKDNGELGLQTMAPPSVWEKNGKREPLEFRKYGDPTHWDDLPHFIRKCCYAAIGMLLAKRLGHNGFGHDARMAWAGYLLRAGVLEDDLVRMGEAISLYCNNKEIIDVRRVVQSTISALHADGKKSKGGPALAKIIGGEAGKKVIAEINKWLGRDVDFVRNNQGMILAKHHGNIRRAVELLGHELSYDEFAEQMLMDHKPLEDPQWKALYIDIENEYRFQPPADYFRMVLEDLAWRNRFHPVKQYLDSLTWDGVPRVDRWLVTASGADDTAYVRAISAIMLVAAVRRIYHPGAKYDEMVVWESPQGMNKSSAVQALCPYTSWFSDDLRLNLHAKELIEATLGKWIIEASDLAGKRKTEIEQLKAMMSRQVDGPARMAYAHFPVQRPRHFIIIGTTNSSAYLTDSTGGRRFWPMTVDRFDVEWIRVNRDQLWAEAVVREKAGASIRLPEELWPDAGVEQEKRQEIDPWEFSIRKLLVKTVPGAGMRRRVTTNSLWEALSVPIERRDRYGSMRISEIMHRLGFKRTRVRPEGEEVQVGFIQDTDDVELDSDGIERSRHDGGPAPF